ncbi:FeMo cofactor biosynthesis protein NifB [mine drainage metagenome]|uniref:FeMo cofactor biosynthesis protein NifB n=1 Tax=mine drainage metagenome TaxID=410659 RepID=A0A1J5PT07_9ZZZZ
MEAGIEPVDQYVGEFIEKAALDWFNDYRLRVASGAVVHKSRGDAQIRQGAFANLAGSVLAA